MQHELRGSPTQLSFLQRPQRKPRKGKCDWSHQRSMFTELSVKIGLTFRACRLHQRALSFSVSDKASRQNVRRYRYRQNSKLLWTEISDKSCQKLTLVNVNQCCWAQKRARQFFSFFGKLSSTQAYLEVPEQLLVVLVRFTVMFLKLSKLLQGLKEENGVLRKKGNKSEKRVNKKDIENGVYGSPTRKSPFNEEERGKWRSLFLE